MDNIISLILTITILLWAVFQPSMYMNAMLVEESLATVVYETQKEAALNGKYDQQMYDNILRQLGEVHKFDTSKVEIRGTEELTYRGEPLTIQITVPKPPTNIFDIFTDEVGEYTYTKQIMSEFTLGSGL